MLDRDAQFRHINAVVRRALAAGLPVISVDTKMCICGSIPTMLHGADGNHDLEVLHVAAHPSRLMLPVVARPCAAGRRNGLDSFAIAPAARGCSAERQPTNERDT
jgi:hypothetical protein